MLLYTILFLFALLLCSSVLLMVQANPAHMTPEAIEGVKDQVKHFFVTLMDEAWV